MGPIIMKYPDFVKLAVLLGCDYCDAIKNIKPYELFMKFVIFDFKIECVIKHLTEGYYPKKNRRLFVPDNYLNKFNDAYNYYTQTKVHMECDIDRSFKKPNINDVYTILQSKSNFNFNYVKGFIQELSKYNNLNMVYNDVHNFNKLKCIKNSVYNENDYDMEDVDDMDDTHHDKMLHDDVPCDDMLHDAHYNVDVHNNYNARHDNAYLGKNNLFKNLMLNEIE